MDAEHRIVEQVNEGFYRAFESGSLEDMERVWACDEHARCTHPGWPILAGWEAIRSSWEGIFHGTSGIRIEVRDVRVRLVGDVACVTCVEHFDGVSGGMPVKATIAATNVYERRDDRWALVHHHGSPLSEDAPQPDGDVDRTLH